MKAEQWLQTLQAFFLDILGTLIPGLLLLEPVMLMLPVHLSSSLSLPPKEGVGWCFHVILGYVVGQVVTSVGQMPLRKKDRKTDGGIAESEAFKSVARYSITRYPYLKLEPDKFDAVHQLRNIALSIIDSDDRQTVVRFMFISLLNVGALTALALVLCVTAIGLTAQRRALMSGWHFSGWVFALAVCLPFFRDRRDTFYRRAMRAPFSMLVGQIARRGSIESTERGGSGDKFGVYLAGGFHSGWQKDVLEAGINATFYDPRSHQLETPAAYTAWDLEAIGHSQVVFACIEASNPGLYALALEVGYAKALGKRVIVVEKRDPEARDVDLSRRLAMVYAVADGVFGNVEDGVVFLKELFALARSVDASSG